MLVKRTLAALAVTFSVPALFHAVAPPRVDDAPSNAAVDVGHADEQDSASALKGLWYAKEPKQLGDPVRFYYFHDGGVGLYRYGRLGLNHTNSYDYRVDGDRLLITFRKTGEQHGIRYSIEKDDAGDTWLTLFEDPREPVPTRYMKERTPPSPPPPGDNHPFARMWMNIEKYQTGGMGFHIYQFKPPALDGRGVGWYHEGDFDDWSTEMLTYRKTDGQLELGFAIRHERATTPMVLSDDKGLKKLELKEDPRRFWQARTYVDGGASFAYEGLVLDEAGVQLEAMLLGEAAGTD